MVLNIAGVLVVPPFPSICVSILHPNLDLHPNLEQPLPMKQSKGGLPD
jgi:hypothetical protein